MSKGTTLRNVRVPDDLWDAARDRAQAEDRTLSDIVRQALIDYVAAQNTPREEKVATRLVLRG